MVNKLSKSDIARIFKIDEKLQCLDCGKELVVIDYCIAAWKRIDFKGNFLGYVCNNCSIENMILEDRWLKS